jgi:branched-subunit amino acid transport protein
MTMNEIILIGGMALVTFTIRYSMFAVVGRIEFPDRLVRALRYVPPAVLTAIIVPSVLIPSSGDEIVLSYTNPYLIAALFAFGVGWWSKNLLLTIILGMIGFWAWQWVLMMWLV